MCASRSLAGALPSPTTWRKKEKRILQWEGSNTEKKQHREMCVKRKKILLHRWIESFFPSRLFSISFSLTVSFHQTLQTASGLSTCTRMGILWIKTRTGICAYVFSQFIFGFERLKLTFSKFTPNFLYKLSQSPVTFQTQNFMKYNLEWANTWNA